MKEKDTPIHSGAATATNGIVIDKHIPLPINNRRTKYPFKDMSINDSFFIQAEYASICQAAYYAGRRNNMKFTVRHEGNGVRVWRIA